MAATTPTAPSHESQHRVEHLDTLKQELDACRACPLWKPATQGVPGEGGARARLMFVGEQPGDEEDIAGRPFVGPAGRLFDTALEEAGIARREAYITNAVKHFKFTRTAKKRLHKRPSAREIDICRWWLDEERRLVRPRLVVALGATAARSLLGRPATISKLRGQPLDLGDGGTGFVTIHPSYLLRIPGRDDRHRERRRFVAELKKAGELAKLG